MSSNALNAHERSRRRWFIVSVVVTTGLVVAGWAYFFTEQVKGLARSVPATLSEDLFQNAATATQEFGQDAAATYQETVGPTGKQLLTDVQARIEAQVTLGQVVNELTTKIDSETQTETE
ncbi:MAG: hypothetical protein AAB865_00160 [Patescibacteria group bacterium]